jgi:hypothetical protein
MTQTFQGTRISVQPVILVDAISGGSRDLNCQDQLADLLESLSLWEHLSWWFMGHAHRLSERLIAYGTRAKKEEHS